MVYPESPKKAPYLIGKLPYSGDLEAEDFISVYEYGEVAAEGKYRGFPKELDKRKQYFKDLEAQKEFLLSTQSKALMLHLVLHNAREYINE